MSVVDRVEDPADADGTVLEGIRQKVFLDRYSLKDREGSPIEHYPEDMWRRVATAIAEVEPTEEKRAHWAKKFYSALQGFQFVPGGRILAGAGSGHQVTYYNCFQGDTLIHTRDAVVPIGSLVGEHDVLSDGGVFRPAFFRSYGNQRLWEVSLNNGASLFATGDHQWVVTKPKGGTRRVLTRELKGERIPINPRPAPPRDSDFAEGARHGVVFGDGTVQYGRAHVCLFGESELLASWFGDYGGRKVEGGLATKTHVRVQHLPAAWKDLPLPSASPSYWRGFVAGLIAADGHVDARGSVALYNKDATVLAIIANNMAVAGLVSSGISLVREESPFDGSEKPLYRLQFFKSTIESSDLLLPSHRANFEASPEARQSTIQVVDVRETDRVEEVFCCVEPETHTITVGHGYLTGQCYVIPSPDDSRSGILDNLKIMTEIMARGGGVGINLSSLRPRGSYIRTVNGTASGPCSWAQLYSVATGDVIIQGGSRRGALMLMLDDDHPDIEEFITVKRKAGTIEHANLSVCVSDAFMAAVDGDDSWELKWNGEVRKTVQARDLWSLICESAWTSAEPGVVFMDRYNQQSNTWYYENIRCVNPCGEQGLPPWGVCNLGALNLAAFVHGKKLDYPKLAEHAATAIRFLDDVIDANDYFIEDNRVAQLGTRRTGLGTMGLADALLALEVRYGSDESLELIDRIYATIRDAAYESSCDIASEKGAFPRFESDKYVQGAFIKRLPERLQNRIAQTGTRNAVILTQAPTGTTSLLAGVSSGIEPVFDFAMVRRDRTGEHILYHPQFEAWRKAHPDAPIPEWFVKSSDLTPDEHVRVQALIQRYTDSSISKTVNAPNHHTVGEVDRLYRQAYELGCKGVTYYRDGSRDAVLTHLEEKKAPAPETDSAPTEVAQLRPRPHVLTGATYRAPTPVGTAFVTINSDVDGNICEVFITVGRAGSDVAADAEAIGRLISLNFRVPSGLSTRSIAEAVVDQLSGIGGSASLGFGNARVRSLADAVAKVLGEHLSTHVPHHGSAPVALVAGGADPDQAMNGNAQVYTNGNGHDKSLPGRVTGDFCPSCGQIALVNEEGCHKCYVCGYSSC